MSDDRRQPTFSGEQVNPFVLTLDDETVALLYRLVAALEAIAPPSKEGAGNG